MRIKYLEEKLGKGEKCEVLNAAIAYVMWKASDEKL